MFFKIKKGYLLIILILLQSCSGGKIGKFLESSFGNIEETKIEDNTKNNIKNEIVKKSEGNKKNKNIKELKIEDDTKNNEKNEIIKKSEGNKKKKNSKELRIDDDTKFNVKNDLFNKNEEDSKNKKKFTKQNISRQKREFQPQSYKIIFILKDVDPKDPIEDLSIILRNSDVNFEIEKIERFFDSKNKSIKN